MQRLIIISAQHAIHLVYSVLVLMLTNVHHVQQILSYQAQLVLVLVQALHVFYLFIILTLTIFIHLLF